MVVMTTSSASATPPAGRNSLTGHPAKSWPALEEVPTEIQPPVVAPAGAADAAWAIFQELRPHFDGLLPAGLVHDYVNQAVKDLHGSISIEALPEMAIRLAAVRLRQRHRPDQPADELQVFPTGHEPHAEAPRTGTTVLPFAVIPRAAPGGATPISMTVTTSQAAIWTAPDAQPST